MSEIEEYFTKEYKPANITEARHILELLEYKKGYVLAREEVLTLREEKMKLTRDAEQTELVLLAKLDHITKLLEEGTDERV